MTEIDQATLERFMGVATDQADLIADVSKVLAVAADKLEALYARVGALEAAALSATSISRHLDKRVKELEHLNIDMRTHGTDARGDAVSPNFRHPKVDELEARGFERTMEVRKAPGYGGTV